jgi:UDP-N-acetylglucosamine pyrophosphorylase
MNHAAKYWIAGLLALLLTAQAQPDKLLEKYKPVMELSTQVMAMLELEKTAELTLSPSQASSLLPILTSLQTRDTLTNDEATAFTQQITQDIFTAEQRDWVATRSAEILEEKKAGQPPGGFGLAMRLMNGEPVNLVRDGFSKDDLNEVIELLGNKAD